LDILRECLTARGLGLLVDAFIHLNDRSLKLAVAGTMGGGDAVYVADLKGKLEKAGLDECVEWYPDLDRTEKVKFLQSLAVFSVPATSPEAFGLYLIEAMACGVPVVTMVIRLRCPLWSISATVRLSIL